MVYMSVATLRKEKRAVRCLSHIPNFNPLRRLPRRITLPSRNLVLTVADLVETSAPDKMEPKGKRDLSRLSLWGLLKEIFDWYPSEYPVVERK